MRMKKVVILGLLFMGVLGVLFPVRANAKYYAFNFKVATGTNSGKAYSASNPKDDNDQYAHVYTNSHNLISSDVFYYRVVATAAYNREACSNYKRITPNNASYNALLYKSGYAWQGAQRCLEADTDKYSVSVSGNWWS